MTKPIARDPIYRRRGFDANIIELCVRWYITYRLSYRDLVEMMAERGIQVAHSTILRSVTRFVPEFEKLNNIVEQDHRAIKRRCASMAGFKSSAITIAGIELAHRIRKGQFSFGRGRRRRRGWSRKEEWAIALA
jgi:transposase-like protein